MKVKRLASRAGWRWALKGLVGGLTVPVFCLGAGLWPSRAEGPVALAFDLGIALFPVATLGVCHWIGAKRRHNADDRAAAAQAATRLAGAAFTDRLTGLPNRAALSVEIDAILAGDPAVGKGHGVILLDLDRFRFVNETFGRETADQILFLIGQRLRAALGSHAVTYRLGSDEFAVVVPGTPSRGKIEDIVRLLGGVLREPFEIKDRQFWTGGSIGATFLAEQDTCLSDILCRAELALRRSKEKTGNSLAFHEPGFSVQSTVRQTETEDFGRAIADGAFYLEYQPIIGVQGTGIRSLEALVRWRHAERGVLYPEDFIARAEKSGAMAMLGRFILQTACRHAAAWPEAIGLSVNVSAEQVRDRDFVSIVQDCLSESGLAAHRLTLEVTESVFSVRPRRVAVLFRRLRRLGVRIAIDDFGVGFSSMDNLRIFPIDQLKVDRSFTESMLSNKRDGEVIDLMLKMGAALRVSTIVEGVETATQLELVRAMGAEEAQGFHISPPVPAADVAKLISAFDTTRRAAVSMA